MTEVREVPTEKIKTGEHDQRLETEDPSIAELAASIGRIGIINPLVVVDVDGELHLIAGHRRLVAARMAGKLIVPCIVRTSEKAVDTEITFAENFFRKDLSPVELSCALADCVNAGNMDVKGIAAGFHRSEHWVHKMIAICAWPADVQEAVHNENISVSAASNLACVTDNDYRIFLVRNAVEQGATARTTAAWLQAWQAYQPPEQAITMEPVAAGMPQVPLVPQAPCICCGQIFPVNELSHVPMDGGCIQIIRQVGMSLPKVSEDRQTPQGPSQAR